MKTKLLICFLGLGCAANAQWENVYDFPTPNYPISFITVNDDLYAGTSGNGVLKSDDQGDTWAEANNGIFLGSAYVFSLASRNDSIYAGGFGEVSFTNNGAFNWSWLNLSLDLNNNVFALIVKDDYLFAGVGSTTLNGVHRKELNAPEWPIMNNGLPENVIVNDFLVHNNILFAGTNGGVYTSTDNAMSWIPAHEGMDDPSVVKALYHINGNLLAGTPQGIFVSSDQGNTWNISDGLPENPTVQCFSSINNIVVAGSQQGAFLSIDNGHTWSDFNEGFENTQFFHSITSLGDYFYAGTYSGIWKISIADPTSALNITDLGNARTVYPNPFSSHTVLEFKNPVRNGTLAIYNLHGQQVKQMNNLSGKTITIQRGNLSAGLYFIRLMQEDMVLAKEKLIITDK